MASQEVRAAITGEGSGDATAQVESELVLLRRVLPAGVAVEVGLLLASAETGRGATGLYVGNVAYGELGTSPTSATAGP